MVRVFLIAGEKEATEGGNEREAFWRSIIRHRGNSIMASIHKLPSS